MKFSHLLMLGFAWFTISNVIAQGPALLKEINPTGESFGYKGSIVLNDKLIFKANDGTHGIEPWVTDGTTAGTLLLQDCLPGASAPATIYMERLGDHAILVTYSATSAAVWKTDGTPSGTVLVTEILGNNGSVGLNSNIAVLGDFVYFPANNGTNGYEVWTTDGTAAGTNMIKDIASLSGPKPQALTAWNGHVYFFHDNSDYDNELWKTDGTEQGTVLVKDIHPTSFSIFNQERIIPTPLGLFFMASDGVNGQELWISDGTDAGTRMVKNIHPSASAGTTGAYLINNNNTPLSAFLNGKFYFNGNNTANGPELWVTDGTTAGTNLVKESISGGNGVLVEDMIVYNDKIYYIGRSVVDGTELWVSDGTAAGTKLVKEIGPSSLSGVDISANLTVYANRIWFSGDSFTPGGVELWKSDGTANGTALAHDLTTVFSGSYPKNLMVLQDKLIFFANTSGQMDDNYEPFVLRDPSVAVKDLNLAEEISVYPNPADQYFRIQTPIRFKTGDLELFDAQGQLVGSWKNILPNQKFELPGFHDGIYWINLIDNKGQKHTSKIILQNMH